ncbi:fimbrial protein [Zobellella sp. DQSA1]|uniref:fimbrial protein n=1 Tax=Zobellella sp. DQSA1 TaxID=3342386 RepID=UPI0035C0C95D
MRGQAIRRALGTAALLAAGWLVGPPLQAQENMSFSGTLIEPPPCTIDDGGTIEVDFGERVGISKVDGERYRQSVPYRIRCEGDATGWEMTLTLSATATAFDAAAVQANVADLGIRLLLGGQPFTLNRPVPVDPEAPPALEAVPVQQPGATLAEGTFAATATLQADYQ